MMNEENYVSFVRKGFGQYSFAAAKFGLKKTAQHSPCTCILGYEKLLNKGLIRATNNQLCKKVKDVNCW